jgi:hypothetical protein
MPRRSPTALFAVLALGALLGTARAGDCTQAGGDDGIAEGRLTVRDDGIILKLPEPMCLEGPEDSDNVPASAEVHVYSLDDKLQESLRGLIGKDVHLRGTFMGAMTQHHKAPIVMQVTEADAI